MKKQFRVQLDFTIDIDEDKIQLNPHLTWSTPPDDAWIHTRLERQRNLFRAVLAQPAALQRYLKYLIFVEFETSGEQIWREVFGMDDYDYEDILLPAIATLNSSDQEWLTGAIDEQVLVENTEEFQAGFSVSWEKMTIIEDTQQHSGK